MNPAATISVWRQLSGGKKIHLGTLGQNSHSLLFQYSDEYLQTGINPAPFSLPFDNQVHSFPRHQPECLPGLFTDSLSEHWGLQPLMDFFRPRVQDDVYRAGLHSFSNGNDYLGCLSYQPDTAGEQPTETPATDELLYPRLQQQPLSENCLQLISSQQHIHGMPKRARVYIDPLMPDQLKTDPDSQLQPWVLRFTDPQSPLGNEQGLADAAYLQMAQLVGIDIPRWQLITPPAHSQSAAWLAYQRPDHSANGPQHIQRLSSLLNNPWWQPSLGYEELIRASQRLCNSPAVGKAYFIRAIFNLLSGNQDDHSKHWSFTQNDKGQWQPAPMYNLGCYPAADDQHSMHFAGETRQPERKVIQKLASIANFSHWHHARQAIEEVLDALQNWEIFASQAGMSQQQQKNVRNRLNHYYQLNRSIMDR